MTPGAAHRYFESCRLWEEAERELSTEIEQISASCKSHEREREAKERALALCKADGEEMNARVDTLVRRPTACALGSTLTSGVL